MHTLLHHLSMNLVLDWFCAGALSVVKQESSPQRAPFMYRALCELQGLETGCPKWLDSTSVVQCICTAILLCVLY